MSSPVRIGNQRGTPEVGQLVHVRSRRWIVDEVVHNGQQSPLVRLACTDDDAQGQPLDVYWDYELDASILQGEGWSLLGQRGFDPSDQFAAFLNTIRWNCVTATDPNLFQSPFRAGIKIDAYQMEPLRKALRLPRVNLFIADDTGLGKTIEAGLIARELLLRKKVRTIVVSAPPSVLEQWRAELEERFGLLFVVIDREYLANIRQERGFGVNPWKTHSRFLISHNLLIDQNYTEPMRAWLGHLLPGSLLILDEAHHAAPASGGKFGIETKFTRAVRDLANRFEHRLFLSATPHNGHSNSFSTLLEILDPHRFTRRVPIKGKRELEEVLVRRLKEDVRAIQGGFPIRKVVPILIDDLPADAPELVLSKLLDQYRTLREQRLAMASRKAQVASGLLLVGLQQRLLSSIEAFARTLAVHRRTVERQRDEDLAADKHSATLEALIHPAGPDDDEAQWDEDQLEKEEDSLIVAATQASEDVEQRAFDKELAILQTMSEVAERHRQEPDAKLKRLLAWIGENMCPGLPEYGAPLLGDPPKWNDRRVIIFTENREGTKRYLRKVLEAVIAETDAPHGRLAVIDGLTSSQNRKEIQRRFNAPPEKEPLRILLATDAAREGLNFQAHCADLFHFDLPWNPGRIEQRNGRIDRKLQPAEEVRCHYFTIKQRKEDRVLEVLVNKTETIRRELGSLSKVIDDDIERRLRGGIRHGEADSLAEAIQKTDLEAERRKAVEDELESSRERQEDLKAQVDRCESLLDASRRWTGFDAPAFRNALSCSLALMQSPPLKQGEDGDGNPVWAFPELDSRAAGDPSWTLSLDTLRAPRKQNQKLGDWRREAPIRPVVFEDAGVLTDDKVHLHLEQRVAQRLLSRFRSQGFVHHDLSRACLAQATDSIPRVVLIGRLALFGTRAERLHEELVPVAARWIDPSQRKGKLAVYAREAESKSMELLYGALSNRPRPIADQIQKRLLASAADDVEQLLAHLEPRAKEFAEIAIQKLRARGEKEARDLADILERQRKRIEEELERHLQFKLELDEDQEQQLKSDIRSWRDKLERFKVEIKVEPERVRQFYEVRATRIEPVGIVYLWPETN